MQKEKLFCILYKYKKIQITDIKNKKRVITLYLVAIKKEYDEQLYVYKFESLEEMEQFFKKPQTNKTQARGNNLISL